jgi:hypothetical protein
VPARLQERRLETWVEVSATAGLDGLEMTRRGWIRNATPNIRSPIHDVAADRRTVTVRFETGLEPRRLTKDGQGGFVWGPIERKYVPAFWPVQSMAHMDAADGGQGIALFVGMPGVVACLPGAG